MPAKRPSRLRLLAPLALALASAGLVWWVADSQLRQSSAAKSAITAAASSAAPEITPPGVAPALPPSFGLSRPVAGAAAIPDAFAKFDAWSARFLAAVNAARGEPLVAEGKALAKQRRSELSALIETDPEKALAVAVPWTVRKRLPPEIVHLLEERISSTAEFGVYAGVPIPGQVPAAPLMKRSARIDGRIYKAFVYGNRSHVDSKRDLPVEGIALDAKLAILDRPLRELEIDEPMPVGTPKPISASAPHAGPRDAARVLVSGGRRVMLCCAAHQAAVQEQMMEAEQNLSPSVAEADGGVVAPSAWTEGTKTCLVIRVDFSDLPGTPTNSGGQTVTPAFATNLVNGAVNTFMDDASYHKAAVTLNTADVTGVLRMPRTAAYYATNDAYVQMQDDALAAAQTAGFTTDNYDRHLLVFSSLRGITGSQFTWAGLGWIVGSFTWYNGAFDARVVPHELGHNYGLRHANLWQVSGNNPVDLAGYSASYGDPVDCMGIGSTTLFARLLFNPWFSNRLDWLPSSAVQTVITPGVYRVYRYDDPNVNLNRTLALRMAKDSTRNYWIGYRRRLVGTSLADMSAGAYVFWGYNTNSQSDLIDIDTPGSYAGDASLNVGSTFFDADAGIQLAVTAAGGTGLDEYIEVTVSQPNRIYPVALSYDVDEASGSAVVTLARSGDAGQTLSVLVTTENATAVAPGDYTTTSQSLTWGVGDSSTKTFTIPITSDATREVSEYFNVVLTPGLGSPVVAGSPLRVNIHEPGAIDPSFAHGSFYNTGSVHRMLVQPDGRIAFVGNGNYVDSTLLGGVGRFEADGAPDDSFDKGLGANILPVAALGRQVDGSLIVGGQFATMRSLARAKLARLTIDGDLDVTFNPGAGPNGEVKCIAVQPDGKIIAGGAFTNFAGVNRLGLVRLNGNGSVDSTFLAAAIPGLEVMDVEAVALQPDGKVLVGGLIYTTASGGIFAGGLSSGILRLHADGTVDMSFDIGAGAHAAGDVINPQRVLTLGVQIDGKIVAGGEFTAFRGLNAARLVRLNGNGSVDTAFSAALSSGGADLRVRDVSFQADGRILVAGDFINLGGASCFYAGRLLPTGARDFSFDAGLPLYYGAGSSAFAHQILMQPDGRVLIATDATGSAQATVRQVFSGQGGNAGVVALSAGSFTVNEGGSAQVQVNRVGGSLGKISINYTLLAGSADVTDFTPGSGTLVWIDGDSAPKFIPVTAAGGDFPEATEFFDVMLGTPLGGTALGEQASASVSIIDPGAAGFPVARYVLDSTSIAESVTTPQQIQVALSVAPTSAVTVPLILGGTASRVVGNLGDYSVSVNSVVIPPDQVPKITFAPGETLKSFTITIRKDSDREGVAETIRIALGQPTGPALLGKPDLHTVSILDDDLEPDITLQPVSRIVALGQPAGPFLSDAVGGVPMTLQWKKNNVAVTGATSTSYTIPAVQLSHAGSYTFHAKNAIGVDESNPAELIVVDTSTKTLVLAPGAKATMPVAAAGNGIIGYMWRRLGGTLPAGATGNFEKTLVMGKVAEADSGTYVCQVVSAAGNLDGGTHILKVFTEAPNITPLASGDALPPVMVSETYSYPVLVDATPKRAPTTFAATGLPPGLKIDAKTGIISGKPTAAKFGTGGVVIDYAVKITASNGVSSDVVNVTLRVSPLPANLIGTFAGPIDRNNTLNGGLGGRFDMTTTATGTFSGKVTLGTVVHNIKGVLDTDVTGGVAPKASIVITRSGKPAPPALTVTFAIDTLNNRIPAGTVSDNAETAGFSAWRQIWNTKSKPANAFDGYYTLGLDLPPGLVNEAEIPQGSGFASFKVALAGTLTLAGKTADGESITGSTFVGPLGELLVFQPLYTTTPKGSLHGTLVIGRGALLDDDQDNLLSGSIAWQRPPNPALTAKTYKWGFGPIDLVAAGGRCPLPALMGAGNAQLAFTQAGIGLPAPAPDITISIDGAGKITVPKAPTNSRGTTLTLTSGTGALSGGFKLVDPNPVASGSLIRPATFQGLLIPAPDGSLHGRGFFMLQQLPTLGPPPTSASSAPIRSGKVTLEPSP